jgi:Fe(3+) dicitrate transport protein
MQSLRISILILAVALLPIEIFADNHTEPPIDTFLQFKLWDTFDFPAILVLGEKSRLMSDIPGSADYISNIDLRQMQPLSGNEALRSVSGLHIVEEEGIGLRVNVGIRGLDPDRSSRVHIMEDGIPVALNPFGEPQMYYTPAIERMQAIEVLKGSGQILFGPQTIGGVINYITADPPESSEGRIKLNGGAGGYFTALASYGNTIGNTGFRLDYLHKRANDVGALEFNVHDFTSKVNIRLSNKSSISIKGAIYSEYSNATYIGLTQSMFDEGGSDFVRIAPDDRLDVQRLSASISHLHKFTLYTSLHTAAFAYTTTRNWQRQDFSSSPVANGTGVIWGDTTIEGGALYMRNSNGHRNRSFEVAGIESRLRHRYTMGNVDAKVDGGLRFMHESAVEQRVNGTRADARSGVLISDEKRGGEAISAWLQHKWLVANRFSVSAGVRSETYFYNRSIYRTAQKDTLVEATAILSSFIPGLGFNYNLQENITMFGGLHRGYAPPRITQALANNGEVYNLDAELSWNYELGVRLLAGKLVSAELTAFFMDFQNQIIPVAESAGGAGSGLVNGGETRHAGIEAGFKLDASHLFAESGYSLSLLAHATYVNAHYTSDRFIGSGDNAVNIRENRTPYAPEFSAYSTLQAGTPFGISGQVSLSYTGDQFTDQLNTEVPAANGRSGLIPAFYTLNASVQYEFSGIPLKLSCAVKNVTDQRFIVSRRPQGIRTGLPRMAIFGLEYVF